MVKSGEVMFATIDDPKDECNDLKSAPRCIMVPNKAMCGLLTYLQ